MICGSGDLDAVIPFLGTRTMINTLATKVLKLKTTLSYRAWFTSKQVNLFNSQSRKICVVFWCPFHLDRKLLELSSVLPSHRHVPWIVHAFDNRRSMITGCWIHARVQQVVVRDHQRSFAHCASHATGEVDAALHLIPEREITAY